MGGQKRYEFRKIVPDACKINNIYIYESAPVQRIVAVFKATEIISGSPEEVWDNCHEHDSGPREDFMSYFEGKAKAHAIAIKGLRKARQPVNPFKAFKRFWPPQSYMFMPWERCRISKDMVMSNFFMD
jgi:predicted transcriptional regulator